MAAFDPSRGGGEQPDMDDILAQMFGGMGGFGGMPGMGGFGGMPGGPGGRNVPRKGRSVEQEYEVTLEELYKGKTTKFSNTKNIVCNQCEGSGGKKGSKSHDCGVCNGRGMFTCLLLTFDHLTNTTQARSRSFARSAPASSPKKQSLAPTAPAPDKSSLRSSAARSARARKSSNPRTSSSCTFHAAHDRVSASYYRAKRTSYQTRSPATSSSLWRKLSTKHLSALVPICVRC
jgi:hypothetical protein